MGWPENVELFVCHLNIQAKKPLKSKNLRQKVRKLNPSRPSHRSDPFPGSPFVVNAHLQTNRGLGFRVHRKKEKVALLEAWPSNKKSSTQTPEPTKQLKCSERRIELLELLHLFGALPTKTRAKKKRIEEGLNGYNFRIRKTGAGPLGGPLLCLFVLM